MNMKYCKLFFLYNVFIILTACSSFSSSGGSTVLPQIQETIPIEPEKARNLTEALDKGSHEISGSMESGVSVAIISISTTDPFEGEYALEELTLRLVNTKKFRMVDRQNLEIIRTEQQLQISGEVDDETAVSIGHLTGAAYVITGSISLWGSDKYLRLKVLDVQTGQIHGMSSIPYGGVS